MRENQEELKLPHNGPAHGMNGRMHRRRMFSDPGGYVLQVRDTLDGPFSAPGFPRGIVLFEAVRLDESDAVNELVDWRLRSGLGSDLAREEIVEAPADTHRCRLYKVAGPSEFFPSGRYVELWDSVEEPYEYRGNLPDGELLATESDFTRRTVRNAINAHRVRLAIVTTGSWGRRCVE